MKDTITVTSKGQTTIPVEVRRKLGLGVCGGILRFRFDDRKGELVISKSTSVAELGERISRHIKPGTEPVLDVDAYFQTNRKADV